MRQVGLIIEPDPDDRDCATVMVDGRVAGRPYRFVLDTGAARTQLETDEYTATLRRVLTHRSSGALSGPVSYPVVTICGHVYVDVHWPGVTAHACWDSGAGATLVNLGFWLDHPDLFEQVGTSVGTDAAGARAETPVLLMAAAVIGGRTFGPHRAVTVDLSGLNSMADYPMDLILGYPTLRQADWLLDFPARRWAVTIGHC